MFLPANCTDVAQFVDDNIGKTLKQMAHKEFNLELEKFDFIANPKGTLSASEKRKMTARIYDKVLAEFNADPNKLSLLKNSALRTGMAMTIDGNNLAKMAPVKYSCFPYPSLFIDGVFPGIPPTSVSRS